MAKGLDSLQQRQSQFLPASRGAWPQTPSEERRQLTMVFIDIIDSTPLSERLDPEDFFSILREYHDVCDTCIVCYGGYVARRFGDGVLVFFGLPQAHENDPERAVH